MKTKEYKYTKSVEYAYPTSTNAQNLGFFSDGCWHCSYHTKNGPGKATKGFKTAREAYDYTVNIDMPWNPTWLRLCAEYSKP